MSEGDYASASSAFAMALKQAKQEVDSSTKGGSLTPGSLRPLIHSSVQVPFEDQKSSFAIFTECLTLSPIADGAALSCSQDSDFIAAVILYNVALAYHLRGQAVSSTKGLCRASDLYILAVQLCQNLPMPTVESTTLLLSLANNLAALALEFCSPGAFAMQRRLMSEIMTQIDAPDFFCSNFVSSMDVLAQPAAAA